MAFVAGAVLMNGVRYAGARSWNQSLNPYTRRRHLSEVGCAGMHSDTLATPASPTSPPAKEGGGKSIKNYGSVPPPLPGHASVWGEELVASEPIDLTRCIFCNRSLNMNQIRAVGFDMDYTLAQYVPETFEALAHRQTVETLVNIFNYPPQLREFQFRSDYMMKGLVIDKKRGNMLKADRHKFVKIAYHGFAELAKSERDRVYWRGGRNESFEEPEYAMVDTLFSLAEAYLFMQLVELKDGLRGTLLDGKSYEDVYRDLRTAVDMSHRDGSIKRAVAHNPEEYIYVDPLVPKVLAQLRASGRKLFLATNSLWDYTHIVMNYLLLGKTGAAKSDEWLRFFDVVIVGCGKPGFFSQRSPLFAVDPATGSLRNTDNGAPIIPIDEGDISPGIKLGGGPTSVSKDGKACVYQGGSYLDLHRMLGVSCGSEVLYVGDHIYGDILRSKKSASWRTMLVVPELAAELEHTQRTQVVFNELQRLRDQRDAVDDQIQRLEWVLRASTVADTLPTLAEPSAAETSLSSTDDDDVPLPVLAAADSAVAATGPQHTGTMPGATSAAAAAPAGITAVAVASTAAATTTTAAAAAPCTSSSSSLFSTVQRPATSPAPTSPHARATQASDSALHPTSSSRPFLSDLSDGTLTAASSTALSAVNCPTGSLEQRQGSSSSCCSSGDAYSSGLGFARGDGYLSSLQNVQLKLSEQERLNIQAELQALRAARSALKSRATALLRDHHTLVHPIWGALLKTGHQNSRYAQQVERFACLYTSHVSNLAYYSPDKSWRARTDYMAHETL